MTETTSRQSLSSANVLRVIVLTLGAIVLLLFLWYARALFLTMFLGIIFGLALARAADRLERLRIRRSIGAPLVMFVVIGGLVGLIAFMAPRLREQTRDLSRELPKALQTIEKKFGLSAGTLSAAAQPAQPPPQQGQLAQRGQGEQKQQGTMQHLVARESRTVGRMLFPVISSTAGALAGLLIVIFIAIYIGVDPGTYRDGILHLVPHEHRGKGKEVLAELDVTLREWLIARLIAVVIIGAVTAGALAALGVKAALALGVIAGLLEFVPYFGPVIAAIPAIGVALIDSPQKAFYVVLLYIVIQQIEGDLLTPLLLKKRLDVPPVLTIVAVSALGIVFGVLGMLVAEPIAAATMVLVKMLYVRDVVGDKVKIPEVS